MYTLYTIPGSCSTGIVVLLEKLGVEYTPVKREDVPEYATIVPTNQVPALKTEDGQIITEGAAIVLYLLEKHNADMFPDDLGEKAEFLRWLMFNYATMHPGYSKMFAVGKRVKMDDGERAKVLEQLAEAVSGLWKILDTRLAGQKYIVGDTPTIVDYLAVLYTSWGNNFSDVKIALGENVERLVEEISALPEFKGAYAKENIEFKKYVS